MGDWLKRWLVPGTPRRKAWQALAYLVITVIALTAAGIKYASASRHAPAPAGVSTQSPGDGGAKVQGTKGPVETPASGRTVIPSRSYTSAATSSPSHRSSIRLAPSTGTASLTPHSITPGATSSVTVTATPEPPATSPAPSSAEPSVTPTAPPETTSAPTTPAAAEVTTTATPAGP